MVRPSLLVVALVTSATLDVVPSCRSNRDDPQAGVDTSVGASVAAIDPTLAEPIRVSKAVPADAAAVMVVRAPERLFDVESWIGWFGSPNADDDRALYAEVDAFLRARIGVALTSATSATVFYAAEPERFGMIIEGIEGEPRGPEHSRHGDTILRTVEPDVLVASRGSQLLVGTESAIVQMLDALDGKLPALVDDPGPLAALLSKESAGASFVVVAELARLPADIVGPATQMGLERGYFGLGNQGLHVVAVGSQPSLLAATQMLEGAIAAAQAEVDEAKQDAMTGDDLLEGVGAIVAAHTSKRLAEVVRPVIDGNQMVINVPLNLGQATPLVALLGVGAAVAVPALQKYMRRAKTSEARVQLARLFDATSTYFMDGHVGSDPTAAIVVHQCPNNGQPRGEAGITPPLSVNCNDGPGGRCVPAEGGGGGPGYYDAAVWRDNSVWSAIDYLHEQGHYFHYNLIWDNGGGGGTYGTCMFTVQAFADLDDDGVYSTYERSGAGDQQGVNAAIGMYIDNEVE